MISSLCLLLCWGYLWKLSPLCVQWFTTALHCLMGHNKKYIYCMRNDEGSKSRSSEWYPRWNLTSKCFTLTGSMTVRILRISWSVLPRRWIPREEPTLMMVFCCKEHKTLLLCYSTCDFVDQHLHHLGGGQQIQPRSAESEFALQQIPGDSFTY